MHYGPRVPSEIQLTFPPRKFLRATEYRSISLLSFTPNVLRDREYIQKQVEEAPLSFGKRAIIWLNSFVSLSIDSIFYVSLLFHCVMHKKKEKYV